GIGAAYPAPAFTAALGTIEGTVTRGGDGAPLPGALVTAVSLDAGGAPLDTVSSDYTDERGRYHLRGLAPGVYGVRLTPLDGEVGGFPLTPEFVSERVAAGAQTNFAAEWRSDPETASDDPDLIAGVTVGAGTVAHGIDIVSNIDTTPPFVTGVAPADLATGVRIDPTILVAFSERIDPVTLNAGFRLHVEGSTSKLGGSALLVNGGRTIIFNPTQPLALDTRYVLDLTSDITDRQGVPLAPPFSSHFHTLATSSLAIADVEPPAAAAGAFITILGGGFDPAGGDSVAFDGAAAPVPAFNLTPSSMVAAVPPQAASGSVRAIVHGGVSNS